MYCNPRVFRQQ